MNDKKLNKIVELLIDECHPKKIILFGSRGKGTDLPNSDYDLAIESKKINFRTKRKVVERIDKFLGLNKIDLVFLNESDKRFRKIILDTGRIIYER